MLRALFLDLDQTLVDINGDAFLDAFAERLARHMAAVVSPDRLTTALMAAAAQLLTISHPGRTNRDLLWETLSDTLALPLATLAELRDGFLASDLGLILPGGQACPGAHAIVQAALGRHLKLVVATMPIYPRVVILERLRRGHLDDVPWDAIATDELHSVKPHEDYFRELAALVGVAPDTCLMVGDDYFQDIAARRIGMATYYVGPPLSGVDVGPSGSLHQLAAKLRQADEALHRATERPRLEAPFARDQAEYAPWDFEPPA